MKHLVRLICLVAWITGWVIAKGFWSTFFAVIFPPWGWYLIIDMVLRYYQLI